jgi:hypothetical protein
MRDYGAMPWHVDGNVGFTLEEIAQLVIDQDARWKSLKDAESESPKRRR